MDDLVKRRRAQAMNRLPSAEDILEMFETNLEARFTLSSEPQVVVEARRRIRAAASEFGRPVRTHHLKDAGLIFGLVPLTSEEQARLARSAVRALGNLSKPKR